MEADVKTSGQMPSVRKRRDYGTFIRYVVVGVSQNLAFYAVTLFLLWLGLTAWQATIILYPIATTLSFLANRSWSFGDRRRRGAEFRKYLLLYIAVYPLAILLNWAQETSGIPSWLASLVTMAVAAAALFVALNSWVFRR